MHTLAAINSTSHYIRSYENVQNVNVRLKRCFSKQGNNNQNNKKRDTHGVESITAEEIKEVW